MKLILKPFKWITGLIAKRVMNPLSQALLIFGMVFSVVVAVGSVIAGYSLMAGVYKLFATPCIALGCFSSGFLFQMFMSNYIFRSNAVRKSDYEKSKAESEECIVKLKDELAESQATVNRLRAQRIDMTSFKQIAELALAEIDMNIDDVRIDWLKDKIELDKMLRDDKCPQYIGVYHKECRAKFGLDMKSVRLSRTKDKKIVVYGLEPTYIGSKDDKGGFKLRQIQTFRLQKKGETAGKPLDTADELVEKGVVYRKDLSKKVDVCADLNKIEELSRRQERELQERINNGFKTVQYVSDYVGKVGRSFIECLLKTRFPECEIEFSAEPNDDATPMLKFIEDQEREAKQIAYANQNARNG